MEIEISVDTHDAAAGTVAFGLPKELVAKLAIGGCVVGVVAFFCVVLGDLWSQLDNAQKGISVQPHLGAIAGMVLSVAFAVGSMMAYGWTTLAPASVRTELRREREQLRRSRRASGGGGSSSDDGTLMAATVATTLIATDMAAHSAIFH